MERGDGGTFIEIEGGALDGDFRFIPGRQSERSQRTYQAPAVAWREQPADTKAQTEATAKATLLQLLSPAQQRGYDLHGTFWEPFGEDALIQLGIKHHLTVINTVGSRRVLCVVPKVEHGYMPPSDEWANLLLLLRHDHQRFNELANLLSVPTPPTCEPTSVSPDALRRLVQHLATPPAPRCLAAYHLGVASWLAGRREPATTLFSAHCELAGGAGLNPQPFAIAATSGMS